MLARVTLTNLMLIPALLAGAAMAQDLATSGKDLGVVAEVNGDKLTAADLDQQEGGKLLQARYAYYEAQRKALDELIDQHLLQQQARKEGVTVDQLLDREVKSKIKSDPSEDELRIYYEGLETDKSFDEVKDKIRGHIHDVRVNKAKAAYLADLRKQAKIVVELQPPAAAVDVANSPVRGNKNAPVMLVEFADYQCPYCQKIHPDLGKLQKEFGDNLAVVYKDYPLPMHSNATKAAEAARCAGDQGKFWEYHDLLFADKKLEPSDLKQQAVALKLDSDKFDKCLDNGLEAGAVEKDAAEGKRLGLTGTPSFFVNGHFFSGALTYAALRDMVAQQLNASSASKNGTTPMESSLR